MTKRRRKTKAPNNKGTMIEYAADQKTINQLRGMGQLISKPSRNITNEHIKNCFFCEEIINKDNNINSHLIPESFLKLISIEDKVSTIDAISSLQSQEPDNFFNSKIFTRSATTFFGVCRNCDVSEFQTYENNPNSVLTQKKMQEIALKTLLAFRYFSIYNVYNSSHNAELAKKLVQREMTETHSQSEIERSLSNHRTISMHNSVLRNTVPKIDLVEYEANRIKIKEEDFSKILDITIESKPVLAVQSFYVHGKRMIYVNVFPTSMGSRIIIFKNSASISIEEDREISNLSVIELLAISMVNFRKGICFSPEKSSKFIDGDSIFELLGPRSLNFSKFSDLRGISMKSLQIELGLEDRTMFKRLHTLE